MRYSFVADHFQYAAAIGLIALASAGLARLFPQSKIKNQKPVLSEVERSKIPYLLVVPLLILSFHQSRIYESQLSLWSETVTKNSNSWMAWLNLGHAYMEEVASATNVNQRDKVEECRRQAVHCYHHAMEIAPDEPDPHFNVGYSLALDFDYTGAIKEYEKAVQLQPKFAQAWYSMGNAYKELKDIPRALECYDTALKHDPDFAAAHNNIGSILQDQGDLAAAIPHYQQSIASAPLYARPRFNLANIYLSQGRLPEAMNLYKQAIEIDSGLRLDIERILRARGLSLPPDMR